VVRGVGDQVDTNFIRGAPYKIGEGKKVQNSARFLTTFDFDRECLRNASTCRKSEYHLIKYISSNIGRKNWWTLVHKPKSYRRSCWVLTHPTGLHSGDYNSALRGCWFLRFLHTLQLPKMYFKSDMRRRAASRWALPHISSCDFNHWRRYDVDWLTDWLIIWLIRRCFARLQIQSPTVIDLQT